MPRIKQNEWRELTIEPLEAILPQNRIYQPRTTVHYNSPAPRKPLAIPSTPSTFHMKNKKSRPNTSSTVPAYFSQHINKFFDENEVNFGAGDQMLTGQTEFQNFMTGDAEIMTKKFVPIKNTDDGELELEDWAHNLNDDDLKEDDTLEF